MVAGIMNQPHKPENPPGGNTAADTHFGFARVAGGDKQRLVNGVFEKVADRYDIMNDLMSGGLHRAWKTAMIDWLSPPRNERTFELLDVAGGTGDIALRFLDQAGPNAHATVCDINEAMLAVGRSRAENAGLLEPSCAFVTGNAEQLGFPDKAFDACTIAFGIRNVTHIDRALAEAYRVVRPGGRFLCLEFSSVDVPGLDALYDAYSFTAVPALGRAVAGDAAPYRYLVESIRRFPEQEAFADLIKAAGFSRVGYRNMSGGIVALHSGWRI